MNEMVGSIKAQLAIVPPELVKPICIGAIAIVVFLVLVLFILCVLYVNSRPVVPIIKKNEKKDQNTKKEDEKQKHVKIRYEDLPIISGRLGEILAMNGIINAGPITKIFLQVLDVIKNTTYDIRWRYKLPCLMMVGPENSGKSTILNSLKFEHLTSEESTPMWKLFKKGAVFEMPRLDVAEKESTFWSFLSELFVFIRPRRPLDGIIITLPADMLFSKSVDIETYARDLFAKVFAFQHDINFRLPIYIIITKSDLIPGFSNFAHLLDHHSKQQIFGWSNPNALNTAFSATCIHDLFETLDSGIRKALLIFAKKKDVTEDLKNSTLFATYINQLKGSLSVYLNTMFQAQNPSDGLLLRGVYFVGRHKEVEASDAVLEPSALSPKPYSHIDLKIESTYNDELYFLQDLFSDKIFKEHNIAYPIRNDAIDMTKAIFRNKLIFAGTSLVISVGWFYGNFHIREKINNYFRTFSTIKNMMVKLQHMEKQLTSADDQALLNKQAKTLLQNMPVISRFDFMSVFVPQTWISQLYKEITDTVSLVFDSVVMRTIFIDLNMNTKSVLAGLSKDENYKQSEHQDLFDVSSFATFKQLKDFVDQIAILKKQTREYNSVRHLEDRKDMIDLTNALFKDKIDIVEEMRSHSPNKKLLPPQFDLKLFQKSLEQRLKEVFNAFINEVFNGTIEKIMANICEDINKLALASKQASIAYTTADLARVYQKTVLFSDIMKNKNFEWRVAERFMPSKSYSDMIDTLNTSEIINPTLIKDLLRSVEIEFHKFKDKIRAHETTMTGSIVTENLENVSSSFDMFQKELKTLLGLQFICTPPESSLTTVIMDDKMLIWDVKRLKDIADLVEQYYLFAETMPPDIRAQYFENYKMLCRKCFYPSAQAMLGNAQIFEDIPLGNARNLLEDAYKRQADNIRKSSIFLGKIAKFFAEICSDDTLKDCGFTSMLVSHYMALLEKVDALFNLETPYSTGSAIFDGWNGDRNPQFLNISEDQALKKYLLSQFNRLKFLAKDLASPVVELLSMPVFTAAMRDQSLLDKWREIISNIDDYEAQKPGNSLAALESFLSDTLKKVSINSFDPQGEIKAISENGGDFFTSKRAEVAKALISRADLIQYDKAAASYRAIQTFFNQSLAHKFPFGNSDDEATITDIEKFINIYDQNSTNLEQVLKGNAERKQINPRVFNFLKSAEKLVPFLRNWVQHTRSSDAQSAVISFTIQLRPSPDAEAFTSSVLERSFKVKSVEAADNSNVVFFNGDPVDIRFSWIEGADERPNRTNLPRNLSVDKLDATFSYTGKWAMFRLLEAHKMNKEVEYPNGVMLQFEIPVLNRGNEVLTSRMILKVIPQLKVGDKMSPTMWPVFPRVCPGLHIGDVTEGEENEETTETTLMSRNVNNNSMTGNNAGVTEQELERAVETTNTVGGETTAEANSGTTEETETNESEESGTAEAGEAETTESDNSGESDTESGEEDDE